MDQNTVATEYANVLKKGNKIILYGNGGTAADAQHISTELVVRYKKNRKSIPAISLSTDTSALTAIGNDFGFDYVFSRQIEAVGNKEDLLIAISTSGNSKNVINAIEAANAIGLETIIFTGENGGLMNSFDCLKLKVKSNNVARIQECHILVGHIISKYIEENII